MMNLFKPRESSKNIVESIEGRIMVYLIEVRRT